MMAKIARSEVYAPNEVAMVHVMDRGRFPFAGICYAVQSF
jgi:hypothetical protein